MAVSLIMLLALIVLKAMEAQLTASGREEYRRVAVGLAMLALASLGRLYYGLGALQSVPFLSHEVFFDLAFWITVISGCTLMISGVARWLPLARRHRQLGEERIRRLELLMRIEQLVGVESRLDVALGMTLEHILQHLPLRAGAFYTYSEQSDSFSLLKVDGDSKETVAALKLPEHAESMAALTRRQTQPSHTLMIQEDREPVALLLAWSRPEQPLSNEDALVLRLVGDIVERQISLQRSEGRLTIVNARTELNEDLLRPLRDASDSRSGAVALLRVIAQRFRVDYAALSLLEPGRAAMQRITIGPGGRSLLENSVTRPEPQALLGHAFHRGVSVLRPELQLSQKLIPSELPADVNLRSVLAVPFLDAGERRAVLILAAQAPYALAEPERVTAEGLAPVMAVLLTGLRGQTEIENHQRAAAALGEFIASAATVATIQEAFDLAAALVFRMTSAAAVRISVPDQSHEFLESRVLLTDDSTTTLVPPDGQMVLSLMARHREALNEGRTLAIPRGTGRPETEDDIENRQALAEGLGAGLVVPVVVGSRCWAVVTVGYHDSAMTTRKLQGHRSLIESVAGVLSLIIPLCVVRRRGAQRHEATESLIQDREVKAQMRSSLTGILGSVEMLKTRLTEGEEPSLDRYLSIIDRSARRIDQFVSEGEPSPD